MNRDNPPKKVPAVYLTGPQAHGNVWCATCAMILIGTASGDPEFQEYVKELMDAAIESGVNLLSIEIAESDQVQLQPAITVAPSQMFPGAGAMPVCWSHIAGFRLPKPGEETQQSQLIPGKAWNSWRPPTE